MAGEFVFALVAPQLEDYGVVLRAAFSHPWVASYGVGFGPPLVKANARLVDALKGAKSALDKLDAYLRWCILDAEERARLALRHRMLLTRQHGPMEAELLALKSSEALDLSLRLHRPAEAPGLVQDAMLAMGIVAPEDPSPDVLTGRFLIRLDDPRNSRLLDDRDLGQTVPGPAPAALELRVHPAAKETWRAYLQVLRPSVPLLTLEVGEPMPRARVIRDGHRL